MKASPASSPSHAHPSPSVNLETADTAALADTFSGIDFDAPGQKAKSITQGAVPQGALKAFKAFLKDNDQSESLKDTSFYAVNVDGQTAFAAVYDDGIGFAVLAYSPKGRELYRQTGDEHGE